MSIFPPSGYAANALDGTDPSWTPWFAWYPVKTNVNWKWLRWVECRIRPDDPNDTGGGMEFRLPNGASAFTPATQNTPALSGASTECGPTDA